MNIRDILEFNSHWETGQFNLNQYPLRRKIFARLENQLAGREIILMSGLRRTGKSVLQIQLIDAYLQKQINFNLKNFLYFSFELGDNLDLLPSSVLQELLDLYFDRILQCHPQTISTPTLIALDELQNVNNWQSIIKKYYDLNPNLKFIITGSSSLFLRSTAESLAGRTFEVCIQCLDFEEYCLFVDCCDKTQFCDNLEDLFSITPFKLFSKTTDLFENFLLVGGFPQSALMKKNGNSIRDIQEFIRKSIINKVIEKDLKRYFNLAHTYEDKRLYEICCNESGSFFVVKNIAADVGLSQPTINEHLNIFQKSYLLGALTKFDRSLRKEIRSTRKFYVASPCLMYAQAYREHTEDSAFLGHAVETYAYNKLKNYIPYFYVDKGRNPESEIDFYIKENNVLIESKYSDRLRSYEIKHLAKRALALQAKALVLSKKSWSIGDIRAVPACLL